MKHGVMIKYMAVCVLCIFLSGACTQNDGHIGPLFGSWSLNSMSVDGELRESSDGHFTTMSFQSDIVMFVCADELHNTSKSYATWSEHNDILTLNFSHYSDDIAEGTDAFGPPPCLDMPAGISDYQISKLNSSVLELIRVSGDGRVYIYKFKKTW